MKHVVVLWGTLYFYFTLLQITNNRDSISNGIFVLREIFYRPHYLYTVIYAYLFTNPLSCLDWLLLPFTNLIKKKTTIEINCQSEIFTVIKENALYIPQKWTNRYILSLILKIVRITKQQKHKTSRLITSQGCIDIIVSSMPIEEKITVVDIYNRICN